MPVAEDTSSEGNAGDLGDLTSKRAAEDGRPTTIAPPWPAGATKPNGWPVATRSAA